VVKDYVKERNKKKVVTARRETPKTINVAYL